MIKTKIIFFSFFQNKKPLKINLSGWGFTTIARIALLFNIFAVPQPYGQGFARFSLGQLAWVVKPNTETLGIT